MSEPEIPAVDSTLTSNDTVVGGLKPPVAAGIAVIFTIISGIVFLVLEKQNRFVRFWAMQAVLIGVGAIALAVFFSVSYQILWHLPIIGGLMGLLVKVLYPVCRLGWFVLYVICLVKAFTGKEWEIPWIGKLAKTLLARLDRENVPAV